MSPLAQILAEANRPAAAPQPATIQPTNVAGIYNNYNQAAEDQYKAQLAQQNSMFGGLASLGSAGISVLPKLLGGGGATSALASGSAIPGAVGATSVGGAPLVAAADGGGSWLASALPFLFV